MIFLKGIQQVKLFIDSIVLLRQAVYSSRCLFIMVIHDERKQQPLTLISEHPYQMHNIVLC